LLGRHGRSPHRQTHSHAHEECLRQLEAHASLVKKVAIVKCLQAKKLKVPVAFWLKRSGEASQVEASEFLI
jgi:hypothetical protein